MIKCLICNSENVDSTDDGFKCKDCGYEWSLMAEAFQDRSRK